MIIYKTTNLINNKIYIGQKSRSCNKDVKTIQDLLKTSYYGSNKELKEDIKKYGKKNFKRELIEDKIETIEKLNERENYWIEFYNSRNPKIGYNKSLYAWPFFSGCKHTIISKNKQSLSTRKTYIENPNIKNKISKSLKKYHKNNPNISKNHSEYLKNLHIKHPEIRIKMGISQKKRYEKIENTPMYGKHHSKKTKEKMSIIHSKKVYQYDKKGNLLKVYKSVVEAAKINNLHRQTISACCRNELKTSGNYIWQYNLNEISKKSNSSL